MCAHFEIDQGILPFLELLGIDPHKVASPHEGVERGRPTDPVAVVHNRMPAILRPVDYMRWLDLDLQDPAELSAMLEPMDAGLMEMEFVGMMASARKKAEREPFGAEQEPLFA